MHKKHLTLDSLEKTNFLGTTLGQVAEAGDIICLDGDLGAGKTTLTQAIACGLEVDRRYYVTSPSFAIFHEYPGRLSLYHMDFYRLTGSDDVLEIGLEEYFCKQGLVVIEWAAKASELLPRDSLFLSLAATTHSCRELTICFDSVSWLEKMDCVLNKLSKTV